MNFADVIGQTLDEKYQIERELGRGGMGTVYLATHLGTERPVAIKIIAPQFMKRPEFVERFRREARAAGRLRHPNVVNVTDFGFAHTADGQVAYLVMEYLDGCTLGEILEEEKNLPVGWTLDILEQVCSAVHEAHEQGIIHRDLKPDNIWLEPNQRGGYTVKVLDFGIAKLEEHSAADTGEFPVSVPTTPTFVSAGKATLADLSHEGTIHDSISPTRIVEGATVAQAVAPASPLADKDTLVQPSGNGEDRGTLVLRSRDDGNSDQEAVQTRLIDDDTDEDRAAGSHSATHNSLLSIASNSDLTRVGAVLGTPLYMSPEQCRGDKLDPRSDIYSLGIIAYQMLSGSTPFSGDFTQVMESHKACPPPPLNAKKVRKKLKRVIASAMAKDADDRPQTAEAFASSLRSRSEGIFGLLRRALVIYGEHLPKYLMLTAFFSLPIIVLTVVMVTLEFLKASGAVTETTGSVLRGVTYLTLSVASAFCSNLIVGSIAWIVTQYLAVPLRPVRLRPALAEARKKWKRFAGAGVLTAILPFLTCGAAATAGFIVFAVIPGILYPLTDSVASILIAGGIGAVIMGLFGFFVSYILWILVPPVVMMENVGIREALRRSRTLVKRSFATSAGAVFIVFLIPTIVAGTILFVVSISARAFDPKPQTAVETVEKQAETTTESPPTPVDSAEEKKPDSIFGRRTGNLASVKTKDMRTSVKETVLESIFQIFWLPMQILVFSFSGIIVALLYLKTRLAGGESMNDLIERFEDDGRPRKKWQERVRQRLIQSGRITSRS